MNIHEFIKARPYLVWSTKNYDGLSEEAIVEAVLNYGTWSDVLEMIAILGIKKTAGIFRKQIAQTRTNYDTKITDYFSRYFAKYA